MKVDDDGTVHVPAIVLPESSFLAAPSRAALQRAREYQSELATHQGDAVRFYESALYRDLRTRYPVAINPETIAGVYTEVFTPIEAVPRHNSRRVLINLHGGGFTEGSRTNSHLESIPIAAVSQTKVVSIDYRKAPEFTFPAASEDVAAVYRELLKTYKPQQVGIFGCSAGALLTAQTIAWLQKENLPLPGAVGLFCEGAGYWTEGDTGHIGRMLIGDEMIWGLPTHNPYFHNTSPQDPLAFPVRSLSMMAKFPPSLLISATRDPALSSVVHTHSVLVGRGVKAELHVWDGLGHFFFFDPSLPESRQMFVVVKRFFDEQLATP
jgi:epsilon-lactone hydrolase